MMKSNYMSNNVFLKIFSILCFVFVCLFDHGVRAQNIQFLYPLSCTYGEDCWLVNYVDVDPADGVAQDFKCKRKTYDGHKGSDFAIGSIAQMREGVDVLAAMKGTVLRVRDGEDDRLKTDEELASITAKNRDCGNGVLIDHGDGLQTIYCHLRQNSVVVKPKQKVKAGQKIAQVGMSGRAEFPHVHFGVLWEGGIVDPFTGVTNADGCGLMKADMWLEGLPVGYEPVVIFDGGFRANAPDFKAIERGDDAHPEVLSLQSAAFVLWAGFYNVEQGDEVVMRIKDPDGVVFHERREVVEKTRTRQYYFTGRKIGTVQLKRGVYKGDVVIRREGEGGNGIERRKVFSVRVE